MKLNGVVTINYIINIYINYIIVLLLTLKSSMKSCLQLITSILHKENRVSLFH